MRHVVRTLLALGWFAVLALPLAAPFVLLQHGYSLNSTASARLAPVLGVALCVAFASVIDGFVRARGYAPRRRGAMLPRGRRAVYAVGWALLLVAALDRTFIPARSRWNAALSRSMFDLSRPGVCRLVPNSRAYSGDAVGRSHRTRINAQGFRGRDHQLARAHPRDVRVALLGDSMIFGIGVDEGETLPDQLEAALREALPGRGVEVFNFGVPCTTLHTSLANARAEALRYDPDAVVLALSTNLTPYDICARIRQIERSRVLSWMIRRPRGVEWVNNLQQRLLGTWSESAARSAALAGMRPLVDLQRSRGLAVVYLQWWDEFGLEYTDASITPPDLRVIRVRGENTFAAYERNWAIPGDGHPTPAGHRYYAGLLARALLPTLRGQR